MELARENDFSATLTQDAFATHVYFRRTPPKLRAGRKEFLSMDETKMRHNFPTGSMRAFGRNFSPHTTVWAAEDWPVKEVVWAAEDWQHAAVLECASSLHTRKGIGFEGKAEDALCILGEKLRCAALSLVGWSDAAPWTVRRKESAI